MFDPPKKSSTKTGVYIPQRPVEAQNAHPQCSPEEVTTPLPATPRLIRWPPEMSDYRRPQRLSLAFKWLLAILALLLIFSGLSFIIYSSSKQYGTTLHMLEAAREAATGVVIATTNARMQGTADVVGTMQGNIEASATAVEQASNQAITTADNATAIASEFTNQYSQDISGQATLENPLIERKGVGGWDEGQNKQAKNGCTYRDAQYHVMESDQGYLQPCIAEQTRLRDFLYKSTVTFNAGDQGEAGLLFRINKDNTSYYFFSISSIGKYRLELYRTQGGSEVLGEGENTNIKIGRGQDNLLGVLVQGETYALFVNGDYIDSASDGSLVEGKIGVAVVDTNAPIDAHFHSVQVWSLM